MEPAAPSPDRKANWFTAHPYLTLGALLVGLLSPLLHRAVALDDPLFLWTAERIQSHPVDFFGGTANWFGVEEPMARVNFNPPVTAYVLAGIGAIFGWDEIVLHGFFLGIAFAAAAGVYRLAADWSVRPLLAAVLVVVTPVFLISSSTLMCDVLAAAFWVWAVVWFERGLKSSGWRELLLAGGLAGLAGLTKYSAFVFLPVLVALGWLRKKRPGRWLAGVAVPVLMLAAYEVLTAQLYDRGLFAQAREYANDRRPMLAQTESARWLIGLAFTGGTLLPVAGLAPAFWGWRRTLLIGGPLVVLLFGIAAAHRQIGQMVVEKLATQWPDLLQIALLSAAGAQVVLLTAAELRRQRDVINVVLALWIGLGLAFLLWWNWTINARSLLPIVPPVVILAVRRIQSVGFLRPGSRWAVGLLTASALVAFTLALADCRTANSARAAANEIAATFKPADGRLWFQGHWGFQYYMQKLDAIPVDYERAAFLPGDVLVIPINNSNLALPGSDSVELLRLLEYPVGDWISTMHRTRAGFHAARWGPLPFAFGSTGPEQYYVLKVVQPFRFQLAESALRPGRKPAAVSASPTNVVAALLQRASEFEQAGQAQSAVRTYREALALAPDDVSALNNLAWILAANPDSQVRDGAEAVRLAEHAAELTARAQPVILGTLAAAYAETGDFAKAVATAEAAKALAEQLGQAEVVEANERLLLRYRARQPARP